MKLAFFSIFALGLFVYADAVRTSRVVQQYYRIGGQTGSSFQYHQISKNAVVKKIETWAKSNSLRGIKLTFSNGVTKMIGTAADKNRGSLTLDYAGGELVTSISIWGNGAGTRCGAIRIKTNKGQDYFPKMTKWGLKKEYKMEAGSGIILGAFGKHGSAVDSLGILMLRKIVGTDMVDVKYDLGRANQPQLKSALDIELDNPSKSPSDKGFHKYTEVVEEGGSWSVTAGFTFGQSYKVSGGVPFVAGGSATTSWEVSVSGTYGKTWTESTSIETSIALIIPAEKRIRMVIEYYKGTVSKLPFTARMKYFLDNGKAFYSNVNGIYDGVSTSRYKGYTTIVAVFDSTTNKWVSIENMSKSQKRKLSGRKALSVPVKRKALKIARK